MSMQHPDRDTVMAYVDGQLDAARRARVDEAMAADPRLAAEVDALRAQGAALRAALDPLLDEPVPAHLLHRAMARPAPWARAAAVALWIGLGGVAGALLGAQWRGGQVPAVVAQNEGMRNFLQQAQLAYAVYTPDARRPVEVREGSDLTVWLSRRLARPIVAPDTLPGGLVLMGGRLLPGMPGKPAAQLMYQDARGRRLTVYLRGMARPTPETSFRIVDGADATTFFWIDRNWGYALTGNLPRAQLLDAARALYERYTERPAPAPQA